MEYFRSYVEQTARDVLDKKQDVIHLKYKTSYVYSKIHEPIEKICRRIINKPNNFVMISKGTVKTFIKEGEYWENNIQGVIVMQDKDTKQKFIFRDGGCIFPTFLNYYESKLIFEIAQDWYKNYKEKCRAKKQLIDKKRKDKYRQELTELYKDY